MDEENQKSGLHGILVCAALFILGLVFFVETLRTLSITGEYGPGSGFFPFIVSLLTLFMTSILLFQSFYKGREHSLSISSLKYVYRSNFLFKYIAIFMISLISMPLFGFAGMIFIFMMSVAVIIEKREIRRAAIVSILSTIAIYLLMVKVLLVPVPRGFLGI